MFFTKNLHVNITLDYLQSLPLYKMKVNLCSDHEQYTYGIPTETIHAILDSLGIDIKAKIETGKYLIRSNVDYTKAKECTVFSCKMKPDLPERKSKFLEQEIILPKTLVGDIDILSIGKSSEQDEFEDSSLQDLMSSQVEDRFSEDYEFTVDRG